MRSRSEKLYVRVSSRTARSASSNATWVSAPGPESELAIAIRPNGVRAIAQLTPHRKRIRPCDDVLPVEENHTSRALELLERYVSIAPRDAIYVASMEAARIRRILSTDRAFDSIREVIRVDPAELTS